MLDDRQRQPAALKTDGDRFSGDATAETDDIELLRHRSSVTRLSKAPLRRMLPQGAIVYQTLVSLSSGYEAFDTFV
jgi:hypothetical protein